MNNVQGKRFEASIWLVWPWPWTLDERLVCSCFANFTCFADPVHVAVHFPLQFLFFFEEEKSRPTLHAVFFFGELSRGKGEQQQR